MKDELKEFFTKALIIYDPLLADAIDVSGEKAVS
jgi:hypothetical protein